MHDRNVITCAAKRFKPGSQSKVNMFDICNVYNIYSATVRIMIHLLRWQVEHAPCHCSFLLPLPKTYVLYIHMQAKTPTMPPRRTVFRWSRISSSSGCACGQ